MVDYWCNQLVKVRQARGSTPCLFGFTKLRIKLLINKNIEMKITRIEFNWCVTGSTESGLDESVASVEVGSRKLGGEIVKEIKDMSDEIHGKMYHVDYEDGSRLKVYNPNLVFESKELSFNDLDINKECFDKKDYPKGFTKGSSCDDCEFRNYKMVSHPGGVSTAPQEQSFYCEKGYWKDDF